MKNNNFHNIELNIIASIPVEGDKSRQEGHQSVLYVRIPRQSLIHDVAVDVVEAFLHETSTSGRFVNRIESVLRTRGVLGRTRPLRHDYSLQSRHQLEDVVIILGRRAVETLHQGFVISLPLYVAAAQQLVQDEERAVNSVVAIEASLAGVLLLETGNDLVVALLVPLRFVHLLGGFALSRHHQGGPESFYRTLPYHRFRISDGVEDEVEKRRHLLEEVRRHRDSQLPEHQDGSVTLTLK